MVRKAVVGVIALVAVLAATGFGLYLTNRAPVARPLTAAEIASSGKPYVVKLHAQWCPKCRMTKGVWSQLAAEYDARVHMVVLDFTAESDTEASRAEAQRLGLSAVFDEYVGATG